ncbi:MAG: sigma-54-dependent Fis family transcriptional regulator, partial [Gammaproteobacteria bacterium]|nr:sigma-54-dependent Fis family transcriptional regulator [Gammaproteobacteria bacterium]
PLRERTDDIPELVDSLLARICQDSDVPTITNEAMAYLKQYHFPGNVRELDNILERAITLSGGEAIDISDLQLPDHTAKVLDKVEIDTASNFIRGDKPLEDFLDDIERKAITEALDACLWNKTAAAKELGITFRALRYKLKKLGFEQLL